MKIEVYNKNKKHNIHIIYNKTYNINMKQLVVD